MNSSRRECRNLSENDENRRRWRESSPMCGFLSALWKINPGGKLWLYMGQHGTAFHCPPQQSSLCAETTCICTSFFQSSSHHTILFHQPRVHVIVKQKTKKKSKLLKCRNKGGHLMQCILGLFPLTGMKKIQNFSMVFIFRSKVARKKQPFIKNYCILHKNKLSDP